MDNSYYDIIKLIKSVLDDKALELSDEFDINEISKIAKRHQIITLVYYGALKCGILPTEQAMQEMFVRVVKDTMVDKKQNAEIIKLLDCFNKEKISYMPLKGVLLKKMYPKPEMRPMGDVDILINTAQYDEIKPIMQGLGYQETAESDHELIWTKSGMCVELHKRIVSSYNKDFYSYFGDGWKFAKNCNGTCYSMTEEDKFVYLFTHFSKHYRGTGIGLRHIVDLWVHKKYNPNMDESYIKNALKKLNLDIFYENILKTLSVWFDDGEQDAITEFITSVILSNGVYGNRQSTILASALKESKKTGNSKDVRVKRILGNAFPPYNIMKEKFPSLKKVPILLPLFWVVRIINTFLFKRKQLEGKINEYKIISSQQIDSYKEGLNFVGLDFNFKE